ncbi:MAG: DUF5107 domain-containing protein [Ancalomicrobiaceae bacterium]|nr:DUF5107 domain-containing protein [Ancalomicrobiaceae bacterium]
MSPTVIASGTRPLPMARFGGPSRLHRFRWQQPIPRAKSVPDVGLSALETEGAFAWGADSILPYRVYADYDRDRVDRDLEIIVLDNGRVRAEIAPGFGGRVLSLTDISRQRDLVYRNPVFQPANLASLDAWFSGGIEWNGLIPGHSPFTTARVFAGRIDTPRGPLLRLYEFDRIVEAFWQIDLFLPAGDDRLFVHGRIVNPDLADKHAYWWTNAAIPMRPGLRVFSPADYTIEHVLPDNHLERFAFPDPDRFDGSYPGAWEASTSVFFRALDTERRYIAALDDAGTGMFQTSTATLIGRKFFYFGTGAGGRRWTDHLSRPGEGDYVELQAGICPTQNQRFPLPAGGEIDWTEAFCALDVDPATVGLPYREAEADVGRAVDARIGRDELADIDAFLVEAARRPVAEVLSHGSPWGARHLTLTGRPTPVGLALAKLHAPDLWDDIAAGRPPSAEHLRDWDGDIAVSLLWRTALTRSAAATRGPDWFHPLMAAIIALDDGDRETARAAAERSLAATPTWMALRLKALVSEGDDAEAAYLAAFATDGAPSDLADEIVHWLDVNGRTTARDQFVAILPAALRDREAIRLARAAAAIAAGRLDEAEALLSWSLTSVREGNNAAADLWRRMETARGDKARPLPSHLNYAMKPTDDEES